MIRISRWALLLAGLGVLAVAVVYYGRLSTDFSIAKRDLDFTTCEGDTQNIQSRPLEGGLGGTLDPVAALKLKLDQDMIARNYALEGCMARHGYALIRPNVSHHCDQMSDKDKSTHVVAAYVECYWHPRTSLLDLFRVDLYRSVAEQ